MDICTYKAIPASSPRSPSLGDASLEDHEFQGFQINSLVDAFIHDVYAWKRCYKEGKKVAVLEGGRLVQVPPLTRIGDVMATAAHVA
jgi:hypothetical protein